MENVSFEEAVDFCRRLSERESFSGSGGYRLPADAEWEYACRAGTSGPFWFGSPMQDHTPFARWGEGSPLLVARGMPQLRRKPNPFGLYDMHGNVCELCQDYFAPDDFSPFASSIVESPTGPASGTAHVARGGGYADVGVMCRSASRRPFAFGRCWRSRQCRGQ
jgi:formylglycine-generating enzyme required for sulfatase activity